ncbi:6397_t:CDS:2, partial [Racocetra fulgida]
SLTSEIGSLKVLSQAESEMKFGLPILMREITKTLIKLRRFRYLHLKRDSHVMSYDLAEVKKVLETSVVHSPELSDDELDDKKCDIKEVNEEENKDNEENEENEENENEDKGEKEEDEDKEEDEEDEEDEKEEEK